MSMYEHGPQHPTPEELIEQSAELAAKAFEGVKSPAEAQALTEDFNQKVADSTEVEVELTLTETGEIPAVKAESTPQKSDREKRGGGLLPNVPRRSREEIEADVALIRSAGSRRLAQLIMRKEAKHRQTRRNAN